jgi:hypothetical protein
MNNASVGNNAPATFDILVENGNLTSLVDANRDVGGVNVILAVTGAGSTIGLSVASPLAVNATGSLSATTNGAAGDNIFLLDTDGGVPVGLINAGAGNVDLRTVDTTAGPLTGTITSAAGDTGVADIVGNVVTLAVTVAGTIGTSAASRLEIDAVTLNASTVSAAGNNMFLDDTAGNLQVGLVSAGVANVDLRVAGALTSEASDPGVADLIAANLILQSVTGIGGSGSPIETAVTTADILNSTSGGIFLTDTAGGLVLADLNADTFAVSGVGGNGEIRAASPLSITADAITAGGMT